MNEHDEADVKYHGSKGSSRVDDLPNMVAFVGIVVATGIVLVFALAGCAATQESGSSHGAERGIPGTTEQEAPRRAGEVRLGIRTEALRLSAAGYVLDFRYRVIDPAKAASLLDRRVRPYLLDDASGAQLGVPDTAKLGQLRTTGRNKVVRDQDYFILFANPGRFVKAGSKMTLVMGDSRLENLIVE